MAKTFNELLEDLKAIDEIELLELLDLKSEDLVNEFEGKIAERQATIERYLGLDVEEEETYAERD